MSIPSVEEFISSVADKFVVTASDVNVGINGFVFDIETHHEVVIENEATDHYIENNSAIQDHVAHRPKMITLKGYIGELKDDLMGKGLGVLTSIESLGDIGGLAPNFAQQAAQTYSKIEGVVSRVDSYINQANNLVGLFNDKSSAKTSQEKAHATLAAFADQNILCTVSTPFGIFKDMLVARLGSIQRDDTNIWSDFTVTFKEIRKAQTLTNKQLVFSGRAYDAMSSAINKGQVVGVQIQDNQILASVANK